MTNPYRYLPRFPFAVTDNFTLPEFADEEMAAINKAFSLEHYATSPLVERATRERLWGQRAPQQALGYLACNGFALHTLRPIGDSIGMDTFLAPSPGQTEIEFLEACLDLNMMALPEPTFQEQKVRAVAAALARSSVSVATGISIGVSERDPSVSFGILTIPRMYIKEFGHQQSVDDPSTYGIKLASLLFARLTLKRLDDLRANPSNDPSS